MCKREREGAGLWGKHGEREWAKQAGDEGRDRVRRCFRWAGCGRHEWPAVKSGLPARRPQREAYGPPRASYEAIRAQSTDGYTEGTW